MVNHKLIFMCDRDRTDGRKVMFNCYLDIFYKFKQKIFIGFISIFIF